MKKRNNSNRHCNKCKKPRRRFDHDNKICNVCWKRKRNKYFTIRTGVKLPSKGTERRKRIKENGGYYTEKEWANLKRKYHYRCLRCGKQETPELQLQADHIVPVAKGGTSWISNIQPLCGPCNGWKERAIIDYRKLAYESKV